MPVLTESVGHGNCQAGRKSEKKDRYIVRMIGSSRKGAPKTFAIVFDADYPEEALRLAQETYNRKGHILSFQVEKHTNRR